AYLLVDHAATFPFHPGRLNDCDLPGVVERLLTAAAGAARSQLATDHRPPVLHAECELGSRATEYPDGRILPGVTAAAGDCDCASALLAAGAFGRRGEGIS